MSSIASKWALQMKQTSSERPEFRHNNKLFADVTDRGRVRLYGGALNGIPITIELEPETAEALGTWLLKTFADRAKS